jgi:hypothetical protein
VPTIVSPARTAARKSVCDATSGKGGCPAHELVEVIAVLSRWWGIYRRCSESDLIRFLLFCKSRPQASTSSPQTKEMEHSAAMLFSTSGHGLDQCSLLINC